MLVLSDFRREVRVLLGDESGRRYGDGLVDMGLRRALGEYGCFCPRREVRRARVRELAGEDAVLSGLDSGEPVLDVVEPEGGLVFWRGENALMCVPGGRGRPSVGDVVVVEVGVPHGIKDLDGSKVTTVGEGHGLCVSTGAAGYAMEIRARSITEVFGKRPEDREALAAQADVLIREFMQGLARISLMEAFRQEPWPRTGWVS